MYDPGKFRRLLAEGKTVVGTHVRSADPLITEMLCSIGFQAVWVDMEHSFLDNMQMTTHLIAAQGTGASAIVRIPWNDPVLVKPVLEMAPDGIVFPMICSAHEARRAVAACTYPPKGIRGNGPIRANRYGLVPYPEYLQKADDAIFKIMQIEHVDGVENIEEILEVDGVDGIVIGPYDLSASIGILGQIDRPENKALIHKTFDVCKKTGKIFGISTGCNINVIREYLDLGVRFIFIGFEYDWIREFAGKTFGEVQKYFTEGGSI